MSEMKKEVKPTVSREDDFEIRKRCLDSAATYNIELSRAGIKDLRPMIEVAQEIYDFAYAVYFSIGHTAQPSKAEQRLTALS